MASFNTSVDNKPVARSVNRVQKFSRNNKANRKANRSRMLGYFEGSERDPRRRYPEYDGTLSRFGTWWKGYENAYDKIYDATEGYRGNWNSTFDDNEQYLHTDDQQDEWRDYMDRIGGYYGDAYDRTMDPTDGWVDKDAYDLWGDLATGENQGQNVQDWYQQSAQGQFLEDHAREGFYRDAALGGRTYNPQEVEEYISNSIVAPEAQTAFGNLADYASRQMQSGLDLERWYAEALANGDLQSTQQIADLMNQENQQLWQSNMTQGMGDAQLEYLLQGQLPATRSMDYTNQKIAHEDMRRMYSQAGINKEKQWEFLQNVAMPNAYDSMLWQSGMYEDALKNQESAMNAAIGTELAGGAMGMFGSALGGGI